MIPADLEPTVLHLPETDDYTMVVITGCDLRHDRFALRVQAEFPGLVAAWLRVGHDPPPPQRRRQRDVGLPLRLLKLATQPRRLAGALIRRITPSNAAPAKSQHETEQNLFGQEINALRSKCGVEPMTVRDPNAADVVELVRSINPFFILTLGGAIYGKELRNCARGLAINQHDGWCPEYRGGSTVEWALYHRDLARVANTVHVLTDGMDSGPILRRAICCLADDDTPESCFVRSVALGTELICEVVSEIMETRSARVFAQPQFTGFTYIQKQITGAIRDEIRSDMRRGLIMRDMIWRRTI